ncbi:hypothetical protein CEXT_125921 [Caerostris extrusa]|uniref:Uncharacterized protein n=1 Tax=Caerostris extrusa TaxID=172846 RepID=A0AAV4X421_CAEEX|nr:hypothetical protein CEXT_125921 [Caerostris extrusa]
MVASRKLTKKTPLAYNLNENSQCSAILRSISRMVASIHIQYEKRLWGESSKYGVMKNGIPCSNVKRQACERNLTSVPYDDSRYRIIVFNKNAPFKVSSR